MKKHPACAIIFALFLVFICANLSLAQRSASQAERAQEMLEQDQALREKIETPEKVFIKTIAIEGATKALTQGEIRKIILPFLNKWLGEEDIRQLTDLLIQAYKKKKIKLEPSQITTEAKDGTLKIQINSGNNH